MGINVGTTLAGAGTGAAIGSAFGPIGTTVGAVAGGIGGALFGSSGSSGSNQPMYRPIGIDTSQYIGGADGGTQQGDTYGIADTQNALWQQLQNIGNMQTPQVSPASLPTAPLYNAAQGQAAFGSAPIGSAATGQAVTGNAANMQAALGTGAGNQIGAAGISTAGDLPFLQQQQALGNILGAQAAGYGASPADLQLQRGEQQSLAGQLSVLGSQRGNTGNWGLAQRQAADMTASANANLNQQMGIQRAQETLQAQQALGSVLGQARGQSQAYNANQAQLAQQALLANQGVNQQFGLADLAALNSANQFNAGNQQQMTLANMGALNAMTGQNVGNEQAMALANLQTQGQFGLTNLGNAQQMTLANLSNAQQQNLANQSLQGQFALQQGQYNQQAALANQNAQLTMTQLQQQATAQNLAQQFATQQAQRQAVQNYYATQIAQQEAAAGMAANAYQFGVGQNNLMLGMGLSGLGTAATYLGQQQNNQPPPVATVSDRNLKAGISGGNPMLASYLDSLSKYGAGANDVDAVRGYADLYSAAPGGQAVEQGMGSLAGALRSMPMATAAPAEPSYGQGVVPDAPEQPGVSSDEAAQTLFGGAVSDKEYKDGIKDGAQAAQQAMQAPVGNPPAATSAGYGQPAQVIAVPPASGGGVITPGGYGGGGVVGAPGYTSGGVSGGGVSGGGAVNPGGFSVGLIPTHGGAYTAPTQMVASPAYSAGLTPAQRLGRAGLLDINNGSWAQTNPGAQSLVNDRTLAGIMAVNPTSPAAPVAMGTPVAAPAPAATDYRIPIQNPLVAVSDESAKGGEHPADVGEMLDKLKAYTYRYKDPSMAGAAPGRHLGVMAQDLERSPLGARFVQQGDDGVRRVDYGQMAGTQLAATAYLNDRLNHHEEILRKLAAKGGR